MKQLILLLSIILLALSGVKVFSETGNYQVIFFAGSVQYRDAKTGGWAPLSLDMRLGEDVLVRTGADSRVVFTKGDVRLTIGEERLVSIRELSVLEKSPGGDSLARLRARLGNVFSDRKYVSSTVVVAVRGEKKWDDSRVTWVDDLGEGDSRPGEPVLEQARNLFLAKDYAKTVGVLEPHVPVLKGGEAGEVRYMLFMSWYHLGSYDKCLELSAEMLQQEDRGGTKRPSVLFMTGFIYSNEGRYDACIATLTVFIAEYPDDQLAAEAHFLIAGARTLRGDIDGALEHYRIIVDKYPGSPVAVDAGDILQAMKGRQ